MKKLKLFIPAIALLSLISTSVLSAPALYVSYMGDRTLAIEGEGYESSLTSITVAIPSDGDYNISTNFGVLKEIGVKSDGTYIINVKMPKKAVSGYYDVRSYDAKHGEISETFFFVNPLLANEALNAISNTTISLDLLSAHKDILGIRSDLDGEGIHNEKLIKYINQFMPDGPIDDVKFIKAYLGALLCGGKAYNYDQFMSIINNNSHSLDCLGHSFFSLNKDAQQKYFNELLNADISTSSLSDALTEVMFLDKLNNADTAKNFKKVIFEDHKEFVKLDTDDYNGLKSPETVISTLMKNKYASLAQFKNRFKDVVSNQKEYESSKEDNDNSHSNSGSVSSKGDYAPGYTPTTVTPVTPVPVPTVNFDDIDTHWAKTAILYLKDKGVVNGVGNNKFMPENKVSRAEFAKMIATALFQNEGGVNGNFADVKDADWFASYVYLLSEKGIITGIGDGSFAPNDSITRQDAAVIIKRAATIAGVALDSIREGVVFADIASIADYAKEAVDILYKANLITGTGNGTFDATSGVTRSQAAQMIYNLLTK